MDSGQLSGLKELVQSASQIADPSHLESWIRIADVVVWPLWRGVWGMQKPTAVPDVWAQDVLAPADACRCHFAKQIAEDVWPEVGNLDKKQIRPGIGSEFKLVRDIMRHRWDFYQVTKMVILG